MTIKIEGRLPQVGLKTIGNIILPGFTGVFFYNICFFSGWKYIQANQASLIIACNPIFISLFSALIFKEELPALKIAGLFLSVFGALIVITRGTFTDLSVMGTGKGEVLVLGCLASWVVYSILGKKAMTRPSPVTSVCYSSVAGTLMLAASAFLRGVLIDISSFSATDWVILFYLGFFGTVLGFLWYYQGIREIEPTKVGIFINFVPVSVIILSFFILDEPVTLSLILGSIFVIAGVFLTHKEKICKGA